MFLFIPFLASKEKKWLKIQPYPRRRTPLRTWKYLFYINSSGIFHKGSEVISCLLFPMLSSWIARQLFSNHPGSPFLICCASITSSPFFPNSQRKPGTKQAGTYQLGTLNMFIYRSSGSLGRGLKESCPLVFKPGDLVPRCGVRGRAPVVKFDGVDSQSRGFKE